MIVDLLPTEAQQMISDSIERFLREHLPVERFRSGDSYGAASELEVWRGLADLGVFGLGIPGELGGAGYGLPEEVIAARLMGRHLVSPRVLATMAAARLAAEVGNRSLIEAFASGKQDAAFANLRGTVGELNSDVQLLDAAAAAYIILVEAREANLFASAAAPVSSEIAAIDETVQLQRSRIDRHAAIASATGETIPLSVSLLISAYLAGMSEAARDMAVEYAKMREQFGQPIGAFQAVKHMCAEMAVRSEAAHTQAFYATLVFTGRADERAYEAACARLLAGRAALENGKANVQIHGAMGFTQEGNAHHFLKRSFVLSALASSQRAEQIRIMADVC